MKCLNNKVLVGVGLVAAALLIATPGRSAGLLPVLMMMACPLSMLLMMRAGGGHSSPPTGQNEATEPAPGTTAVEERISALQAELRSLKESQARAADTRDGLAAQPDASSAT